MMDLLLGDWMRTGRLKAVGFAHAHLSEDETVAEMGHRALLTGDCG